MNKQAETAFNQYKDLVTAWGRDVNMEAYENGCQLIEWIENHRTGSTVEQRQDVKATNWESLLSGFPTEAIQEEIQRRIKFELQGPIGSDNPICPGCGQYMQVWYDTKHWGIGCECVIGQEIAVPYQSTREEVIRVQNEAILKYQGK